MPLPLPSDGKDTTEPMTVPLMFRVNGANEHIGHAVVEVRNGIAEVIGISMDEVGMRLLDLGGVFTTAASPLDIHTSASLSVWNTRPKPVKVTAVLTDVKMRREELIREGYKIQGDYVIDFDGTAIPLKNAKMTDGTLLFQDNTEKETNG